MYSIAENYKLDKGFKDDALLEPEEVRGVEGE